MCVGARDGAAELEVRNLMATTIESVSLQNCCEVPRLALASCSTAELATALSTHGCVVLALPVSDATTIMSTLGTMKAVLGPLHGNAPRYRRHGRMQSSSWPRRILLNYQPEGCTIDLREHPMLAPATAAAAEVHPALLRCARAATDALAEHAPAAAFLQGEINGSASRSESTTSDGHFEAFYYPDDGNAPSEAFEDSDCPCPAHEDPGLCTVVAETCAALEAKSAVGGEFQRVYLRPNEVCLVTGQQLRKMSGGALPACMHRVAPTSEPRASYVFEIYLKQAAAELEEDAAEAPASDEVAPSPPVKHRLPPLEVVPVQMGSCCVLM